MIYNVEASTFLPAGLGSAALQDHAAVAERVLGLRGPGSVVFTLEAAKDAARAVALQIALQASTDPDTYLAESIGRGSETVDYRTDPETGEAVMLHPIAAEIVRQLYAELGGEEEDEQESWPVINQGWRS